MAEHTKGPWLLDCRYLHSPTLASGGYHTIDAGDRVNSPKRGYVGFSIAGFMSDADARLIAAAPDLLTALEHAYEALSRHDGLAFELDGKTAKSRIRAALRLAKHGIAPAQAEQS